MIAPARTKLVAPPILRSSARAIVGSASIKTTPARAKVVASTQQRSARAGHGSCDRHGVAACAGQVRSEDQSTSARVGQPRAVTQSDTACAGHTRRDLYAEHACAGHTSPVTHKRFARAPIR